MALCPRIGEISQNRVGGKESTQNDVFDFEFGHFLAMAVFHTGALASFHLEDDKRGFNHVVEIYNRLKLPMLKIIEKTEDVKQAKQRKKDRLNAIKRFKINDASIVKDKKILVVDDVYTTGSSVKAVIDLVKQGKPKKIAILVIAKNIEKTTYT